RSPGGSFAGRRSRAPPPLTARPAAAERALRRAPGGGRAEAAEDVLPPARRLLPQAEGTSGRGAQRQRGLRERFRGPPERAPADALERSAAMHALPVRALTGTHTGLAIDRALRRRQA